jgi:endonuclease IV
MKLTEIPPYDFSRRSRGLEYFQQYREVASKAFTTVTAHAPYYNVVSSVPEVRERSWRALVAAARKAAEAGAEVFNLHLGWRVWMDERDIDEAAEAVRRILDAAPGIVVTLETMYSRRMLGTFDDIRAIMEKVGSDRVQVSVQLENVFMLETGAAETGDFESANSRADESFRKSVLSRALKLSTRFLSLRFSQVIGFALGRRVLKKRVPLGKGYPDLEPLARALAEFMVKEVHDKALNIRMHLIYTGPPETKYRDTIALYAAVMSEVVRHLK